MAILKTEPIKLLLTDLRLGGDSGMDLLDAALALPEPPVAIMMTAYGSVDTAVEAMRRGAWHFVTKPLNLDEVEMLLKRALRSRNAGNGKQAARPAGQKIPQARPPDRQIPGDPPGVRAHPAGRADARHGADRGRMRHRQGSGGRTRSTTCPAGRRRSWSSCTAPRFRRSCWRASCSAMKKARSPAPRSAGSAASSRRTAARLFLDEIGEIDAATQVKLLRVLVRADASSGSARTRRSRWMSGSSPRPTRISSELVADGDFPRGPVFPAQRREDRDAAAARPARRTSCCWRTAFSRNSPRRTTGR